MLPDNIELMPQANATLVFSSVGFAIMEVPVAGRTVVDVTLI